MLVLSCQLIQSSKTGWGSLAIAKIQYLLISFVLRHQQVETSLLALLKCLGISILFCNPADVVRTRIYNQPFDPQTGKGLLYRNGFDALTKIVRTEGVLGGLYKGAWTHYSRLGPHIVLVFVFLEQMKKGI